MQVRLIDLIGVLSRALDLVSRMLGNHHVHVGFLAARFAGRLGMDAATQRDVLLAGMVHDAGAIALHTALESLAFERDLYTHARAGQLLLDKCPGFEGVSWMVGEHHTPWEVLRERDSGSLGLGANIINAADFVDVRLRRHKPYDVQFADVAEAAKRESGRLLNPDCVEVFRELVSDRGALDGLYAPASHLYTDAADRMEQVCLGCEDVVRLCSPFAQVIDFRSRFTATHSRGVAVVAEELARAVDFSQQEQRTMHVAGLLHDIGKLAVPGSILEKPSALEEAEFAVMREHARISGEILGNVAGLELVCQWAGQHHERLDGTGYPFGLRGEAISLGARIIQVADVFTAITEDRPYRAGMQPEEAGALLRRQADTRVLDPEVICLLLERMDDLNCAREREQQKARDEFERFSGGLRNLRH